MQHLVVVQTWAADRWRFIPHPRLRRLARPRRDWTGPALRWMILLWFAGLVLTPIAAVIGFLLIAWLGS